MNELMNTAEDIKLWWDSTGQDKIETLQSLKKPNTSAYEEFRNDQSCPLEMIWTRAAILPDAHRQRQHKICAVQTLENELESTARRHAGSLVKAYCSQNQSTANQLKNIRDQERTLVETRSNLANIAAEAQTLMMAGEQATEKEQAALDWAQTASFARHRMIDVYVELKYRSADKAAKKLCTGVKALREEFQQSYTEMDKWVDMLQTAENSISSCINTDRKDRTVEEAIETLNKTLRQIKWRAADIIHGVNITLENLEAQYANTEERIIKQMDMPRSFLNHYHRSKYKDLQSAPDPSFEI